VSGTNTIITPPLSGRGYDTALFLSVCATTTTTGVTVVGVVGFLLTFVGLRRSVVLARDRRGEPNGKLDKGLYGRWVRSGQGEGEGEGGKRWWCGEHDHAGEAL
jgi:hypothetical protein